MCIRDRNQAQLRIISEKCPFSAAELAEETLEDAYLYQTQDINRKMCIRDRGKACRTAVVCFVWQQGCVVARYSEHLV